MQIAPHSSSPLLWELLATDQGNLFIGHNLNGKRISGRIYASDWSIDPQYRQNQPDLDEYTISNLQKLLLCN